MSEKRWRRNRHGKLELRMGVPNRRKLPRKLKKRMKKQTIRDIWDVRNPYALKLAVGLRLRYSKATGRWYVLIKKMDRYCRIHAIVRAFMAW